jgi:hypothetical protein
MRVRHANVFNLRDEKAERRLHHRRYGIADYAEV